MLYSIIYKIQLERGNNISKKKNNKKKIQNLNLTSKF